jgi:hypothetical protein
MSKPLYFASDALNCYTLDHHREMMRDDGLTTLTVYRAIPTPTSVAFWCKHFGEAGETGNDSCGRNCLSYAPRNGKNGRCRHHTHCYEPDMDKPYTITLP